MKRNYVLLFILLTLLSLNIVSVNADTGPKPSVTVEIVGLDEDYYFDLLIEGDIDRLDLEDIFIDENITYNYYQEDYPSTLRNYYDDDYYMSYTIYNNVPAIIRLTDVNTFTMNYLAPKEFKIILVLKDNNQIITSDLITVSRFNSSITYDLSNVNLNQSTIEVGEITGNYGSFGLSDLFSETGNLIIRLIITLAVELFILFLFKFKEKRTYIIVTLGNVITQVTLSIVCLSAFLLSGLYAYIIVFILGEFFVILTELLIYLLFIKERTNAIIILYTIAANLITAAITILSIPILLI